MCVTIYRLKSLLRIFTPNNENLIYRIRTEHKNQLGAGKIFCDVTTLQTRAATLTVNINLATTLVRVEATVPWPPFRPKN